MIIPVICVTIFAILVVWVLLPRVARLMIHTPTAISILVCLSMVQLMAVFISMRCTLCGHFLQVALTLILVVGCAFFSSRRRHTIFDCDWSSDVCSSDLSIRQFIARIDNTRGGLRAAGPTLGGTRDYGGPRVHAPN